MRTICRRQPPFSHHQHLRGCPFSIHSIHFSSKRWFSKCSMSTSKYYILTVFMVILNIFFHDATIYITVIRYLPGGTSIDRTARVRMQTCGHRLIFTGLCPLAGDRSHVLYSYLLLKLFIAAPQCCRVCHWWSTQILTALLFSHLAFISSFIWNYKYLAHHKTLYTMEIQEYCIFMWLHYYGNVRI